MAITGRWFRAASPEPLSDLRWPTAIAGEAILNDRGDYLPGELYVWPGERSYTRQPTVEFHTIGAPPLLARLVQAICNQGARPAEPGEFTLRAFLAGRLDLTQAEAVLGVIEAGSQTELSVALRQLGGGLAAPVARLRDELLDVLAHLEAGLDFVEEDISFIGQGELRRKLSQCLQQAVELARRMTLRSVNSNQCRVVLYGRPNVGKSSLLNALADSQRAIVSDLAGTTRDYLTAAIECGGLECLLVDTAGLEPLNVIAGDPESPESSAQQAARRQVDDAHLRILCLDSTCDPDPWEIDQLSKQDDRRIVVLTKCDIVPNRLRPDGSLATSSRTGAGLVDVQEAIASRLTAMDRSPGDVVVGTAARCHDSLHRAIKGLRAAMEAIDSGVGEEFVAGEVRIALEELGRIAGAVYTDDLLDRIFSRFCIGK